MPAIVDATWVPWPVDVGAALVRDEVLGLADLAGEVGVVGVDAGVEHRDADAGAVVAGGPGLRRADLRHALVEVRVDPAVEPQLRDAVRRGSAWGRSGRRGVIGVPERATSRLGPR